MWKMPTNGQSHRERLLQTKMLCYNTNLVCLILPFYLLPLSTGVRYLLMTQSTLKLRTAKLLTGSGYFGNMGTVEEVIAALYHLVWSGQCVIDIQPQMADTWASRNI